MFSGSQANLWQLALRSKRMRGWFAEGARSEKDKKRKSRPRSLASGFSGELLGLP